MSNNKFGNRYVATLDRSNPFYKIVYDLISCLHTEIDVQTNPRLEIIVNELDVVITRCLTYELLKLEKAENKFKRENDKLDADVARWIYCCGSMLALMKSYLGKDSEKSMDNVIESMMKIILEIVESYDIKIPDFPKPRVTLHQVTALDLTMVQIPDDDDDILELDDLELELVESQPSATILPFNRNQSINGSCENCLDSQESFSNTGLIADYFFESKSQGEKFSVSNRNNKDDILELPPLYH